MCPLFILVFYLGEHSQSCPQDCYKSQDWNTQNETLALSIGNSQLSATSHNCSGCHNQPQHTQPEDKMFICLQCIPIDKEVQASLGHLMKIWGENVKSMSQIHLCQPPSHKRNTINSLKEAVSLIEVAPLI